VSRLRCCFPTEIATSPGLRRRRKVAEDLNEYSVPGHAAPISRHSAATLVRVSTTEAIAAAAAAAQVRLQPMESVAQLDEILRGRMALGLVVRRVHERRLEYLEVMREASAFALPDREPFRALMAVSPQDLAGLHLLVAKGGELFGGLSHPYLDAVAEVVTADNSLPGALATLIATSDSCCFTLANPEAPWHRNLAGAGVVIGRCRPPCRPLPPTSPGERTRLPPTTSARSSPGPVSDSPSRSRAEPAPTGLNPRS
jgi:hypothetical protein